MDQHTTQLVQESFDALGERYSGADLIGKGSYGCVYKAKRAKDKKTVALKVMELEDGIPAFVIREVSMLKGLQHENIVNIIDVVLTKSHVIMELEFMTCDLAKFANKFLCPVRVRTQFMLNILRGLRYCHRRRVAHRDIKPQNILVTPHTGRVCIADFGMAKHHGVLDPEQDRDVEIVTLWYRPPEVIKRQTPYSCSMDMWSVGCILAELILRHPLYAGDTEEIILKMIEKTHARKKKGLRAKFIGSGATDDEMDLLFHLLDIDPCARITANNALQHEYFK
jgi:serine/threonine protein kinase